jgi:hypothetical protein
MKKRSKKMGFEEQLISEDLNSVMNTHKDARRDMRQFGNNSRNPPSRHRNRGRSSHVIHESYGENYRRRQTQSDLNAVSMMFLLGVGITILGFYLGFSQKNIFQGLILSLVGVSISYLFFKRIGEKQNKLRKLLGY